MPPAKEIELQKGQPIIVQVTREPVGKKGVRVTTKVSLPGRFLVVLPFENRVGISRKIYSLRERRRLRHIVKEMVPEGFGTIIRTVAENKDDKLVRSDLEAILNTWKDIEAKIKTDETPRLVYREEGLATGVIRDLFTNEVEHVYIDSKKEFREIQKYIEWAAPSMVSKVELYQEKTALFEKFGIQQDLDRAMSRKVYLESGGYIVIEHTEAMVVIDVNSGRYAAKRDQELNSLKTNLEAAREISRQIRLRDLGGILVIDFIDMQDERNRKKVHDEVRKELRRDRAKSTVLPVTEFGLMQITRQRMRRTILHSLSEHCPACGGSGLVQTKRSILNNIERWLRRFRQASGEKKIVLTINPFLAEHLDQGFPSRAFKLGYRTGTRLKIESDETIAADEFRVISVKQQKDVTEEYK